MPDPTGRPAVPAPVPPMPAGPMPTGLPPTGTPPAAPATTRSRARGIGLTLAAALLIFVTVLFVLFVVFNTQSVQISLVFADVEAPLVVALLIAAGLGAVLVALASLVRRARRSKG